MQKSDLNPKSFIKCLYKNMMPIFVGESFGRVWVSLCVCVRALTFISFLATVSISIFSLFQKTIYFSKARIDLINL